MTQKLMVNLRLRNLLLASSLVIILVIASFAFIPLWGVTDSFETKNHLSQVVTDSRGQQIQVMLNSKQEKSQHLSLESIPDTLKYSFILSEDKRFFSHQGVDFKSLARAFVQAVKSLKIVSGASTITMQLARIYWPKLSKPTNKLAQIIQAYRIERKYSKYEILQKYFNSVPFAKQVSGLSQACQYFYDKDCSRLSMGQMATLSVIPRNPRFYIKNIDKLLEKRNEILYLVAKEINFDPIILRQAYVEPIHFTNSRSKSYAPHFVRRVLGKEQSKGLAQVSTTLSLPLQRSVQNLLKENVNKNSRLGDSGGILVVENHTGDVLAYVGSPNYFNEENGKVDAIKALRSPGSTLKPFVYSYALEMGWKLSSVIPDVPMQFKVSNGVFSPNNYSGKFSGPQQIRYALANSKNIPALYITSKLGESSLLNFFRKVGFKSLKKDASFYGVGLSLGNGEVSLWELVHAYSSLANKGFLKELKLFKDKSKNLGKNVLSSETAFLISDVLSDADSREEEFGRGGPLEFTFPVAVKTGTSSDYRDHWAVGYTPMYTIGVWKGNADGSALKLQLPSSKNAGVLFREVINILYPQGGEGNFIKPKSVTRSKVCSLSGHLVTKNCFGSRSEFYHNDNQPTENCNLHKSKIVNNCDGKKKRIYFTEVPKIYKPWAKSARVLNFEQAFNEQCNNKLNLKVAKMKNYNINGPTIEEPLSGTLVAIDPTIPLAHQKLRIKVNSQNYKKLRLLVNGKKYKNINKDSYIDWPIKKGKYEFKLQLNGEVVTNATEVTVL